MLLNIREEISVKGRFEYLFMGKNYYLGIRANANAPHPDCGAISDILLSNSLWETNHKCNVNTDRSEIAKKLSLVPIARPPMWQKLTRRERKMFCVKRKHIDVLACVSACFLLPNKKRPPDGEDSSLELCVVKHEVAGCVMSHYEGSPRKAMRKIHTLLTLLLEPRTIGTYVC